MSSYNNSMDSEKPDWNMAGYWIEGLAMLKNTLLQYIIEGDVKNATRVLSQEIDWVGIDLGEKELYNFRKRIDGLKNESLRNLAKSSRHNLLTQIDRLKREVWDLELKNDITRSKNREDYSGKAMASFE